MIKFTHFHGKFKKYKDEITEKNYFVEPCIRPAPAQLLNLLLSINLGSGVHPGGGGDHHVPPDPHALPDQLLHLVGVTTRQEEGETLAIRATSFSLASLGIP